MARLALLASLLAACAPLEREDPHPRIVDQSGAEFFWACNQKGTRCDVHRIAGVSPPPPECEHGPGFFTERWFERFLDVVGGCPLPGDGWWYSGEARFIVCDNDDDCPDLDVGAAFECRNGFCQSVDTEEFPPGPPSPEEVQRLCTEHVPWGTDTTPSAGLAAAIATACPADEFGRLPLRCESIPEGCPDPR